MCHIHITLRPGHAIHTHTHTSAHTTTRYAQSLLLWLPYTVCTRCGCELFFKMIFFRFCIFLLYRGAILFFSFHCHPVRQDGKSYFIRSVHIMNIQKCMWVFVTDLIQCYMCLQTYLYTVRYRWLSCNRTIPLVFVEFVYVVCVRTCAFFLFL